MPMIQGDALIDLIHRARNDDDRAVEHLLKLVRDRMKGFYRERAGSNEMSDFAQEIISKVWQALPSFCGDTEAQFWAWVTELARNRWVDELRRLNRAKRAHVEEPLQQGSGSGLPLAARDERPSQVAVRRERDEHTRAAFDRLTEREQEVIRRRYDEDQSWPEIAKALEKTEAAAKKFYQRAIKKWAQMCGGE
jgi:RNA polymerase sigma factor (sigma-70 family)